MSFFRTADAVTALYLGMLLEGLLTGMVALASAGGAWFLYLLMLFVADYERCQSELRRIASSDKAPSPSPRDVIMACAVIMNHVNGQGNYAGGLHGLQGQRG